MPKILQKKPTNGENSASVKEADNKLVTAPNLPDSQQSSIDDNEFPTVSKPNTSTNAVKKQKRSASPDLSDPHTSDGGLTNEMQKMLECFGSDIAKSMSTKRKRLEQYTDMALKSNRKMEEISKSQRQDRKKLQDEFVKQQAILFDKWEAETEKVKEQDEKLQVALRQQQKSMQQHQNSASQMSKALKQLFEQYHKALDDLEKVQHDQMAATQVEQEKKNAQLQKKILLDTQQEEMQNVRKSLQTMLF